MKRPFKQTALAAALAVLLTLSGCYTGAIDQYFSLPQPADEYLQLQDLIDKEIASGSEYAAPTAGSYRQSVQLYDLDGDGVDEALAFFRDEDRNLKICIYANDGKTYQQVLSIQGEGTSIGSIEYADMDGDGILDLLVAWQLGTGVRLLAVYDLSDWAGDLLLTSDCAEFIVSDMDQDGRSELLILRADVSGYVADMYSFKRSSEPKAASAALSAGITALRRVRTVTLSDNTPALLVESAYDNGDLVSDLFVSRSGALVNITLDPSTGISATRRAYNAVYATDIDSDRCIEIPFPNQLYSQSADATYWSVTWRSYDASGRSSVKLMTYHCFSDGWYLILPSGWAAGLTVRREDSASGERSVVLSRVGTDGQIVDLLILYTLTGENRSERSRIAGRFVVGEEGSTIYAAKLLSGATQAEIENDFKIIYSEWSTGSV